MAAIGTANKSFHAPVQKGYQRFQRSHFANRTLWQTHHLSSLAQLFHSAKKQPVTQSLFKQPCKLLQQHPIIKRCHTVIFMPICGICDICGPTNSPQVNPSVPIRAICGKTFSPQVDTTFRLPGKKHSRRESFVS